MFIQIYLYCNYEYFSVQAAQLNTFIMIFFVNNKRLNPKYGVQTIHVESVHFYTSNYSHNSYILLKNRKQLLVI